MPPREALLDPRLPSQQPVEHRQHLVARHGAQAQQRAQAGGRRRLRQLPGGCQLGTRLEHPRRNGGQGEIALSTADAVQDARQAQLSAGPEHRAGMAVRQRAAERDRVVRLLEGDAALDHQADAFDDFRRQAGEVGNGLLADALAFAPSLPEQDGRGACAIGNALDVVGHAAALHGNTLSRSICCIAVDCNPHACRITWEHLSRYKPNEAARTRRNVKGMERARRSE